MVTILLGNGDGTFKAAASRFAGGPQLPPLFLATGDFNGDGNLDLAVLNAYGSPTNLSYQISILLGHGDGTFMAGPTVPLTNGSPIDNSFTSFAVADFNGDGKLDMVAVGNPQVNGNICGGQGPCADAKLIILLGNGDGTFNPSTIDLGTIEYLGNVVAADLNGDGIPDLAVSDSDGNDNRSLNLLLGNGDGTFAPQSPVDLGADSPQYLAEGDFNGDGIQDLALVYVNVGIGSHPNPNGLMLFFGKGDGTFNAPPYQLAVPGIQSNNELRLELQWATSMAMDSRTW